MNSPGSQNLEFKLVFSSDPTRAASAMRSLSDEAMKLDRNAKEAQKSIARLSETDKARSGFGGAVGGYGIADARGQSAAQAYAGQHGFVRPGAVPPPLPPPLPGQRGPAGGGVPVDGMMGLGGAMPVFGALVAAISATVDGLDRFTKSLDRAATTTDAAGNRLSGRQQTASAMLDTINGVPIGGRAFRFGANAAEMNTEAWQRLFGGKGDRATAREDAYQAELALASEGTRTNAQNEIDALRRRQRDNMMSPNLMGNLPSYLQAHKGRFQDEPGLSSAMMGFDRAAWALSQSQDRFGNANQEVESARRNVAIASARAGAARAGADSHDTIWSKTIASAGFRDSAQRDKVIERENQLIAAQDRLKEALNNKERAGADFAQKTAASLQSQLEIERAKLSITERDIAKKESGAVQFGMMTGSEQLDVVNATEKLVSQGIKSLSLEEKQLLSSQARTAELVKQKIIEEDINNVNSRRLDMLLKETSLSQDKAKKQVLVESTFQLELSKDSSEDIAKQITDTVLPDLIKLVNEKLEGQARLIEQNNQKGRAAQSN